MHAEPIQAEPAESLSPVAAPLRPQPLAIVPDSSPGGILAYAMQNDAPIETIERLFALKQKFEADEARKDYHLALAGFKAEPLSIIKDRRVFFPGKDGKPPTEFNHATLGNVVGVIAPALAKHRMSHSWDVRREGDRIFVTCKLTHAHGHSEGVTLDGALDTTGSKNNIQAQGSTITYLQRYTLLALTGLATEDQDNDGGDGEPGDDGVERISEDQQATLRDILTEAGAKLPAFLEYAKVDSLSRIPVASYDSLLKVAKQKLSAARKAGAK